MAAKKQKSIDWPSQINEITDYAKTRGYEVEIKRLEDDKGWISFEHNHIIINSRMTKERQFYTLLHELGHYIINDEKLSKYQKLFGYSLNKFSKRSLTYLIAELEEETEAWNLGYKLAKKLKLKVDRAKYESYKASMLSTYISYIASIKR